MSVFVELVSLFLKNLLVVVGGVRAGDVAEEERQGGHNEEDDGRVAYEVAKTNQRRLYPFFSSFF